MANRKPKPQPASQIDQPRPHQVNVSLSDDVSARLDEWRLRTKHKRAQAAAVLIELALDSQQPKTQQAG